MLAVERARRGAVARMRRSRLMLWRYRSPGADELLLAPPDLRAHDASFADEVAAGSFGLAGAVANLRGRSPFAIPPPSPAWARELHGFGWLRHLDGARSIEDGKIARKLVGDWIKRSHRQADLAWEPEIVGRRVLAWLAHAALLLDGAERKRYAAVMRSLTEQITYLSTSWRDAPDGTPRLVALIGLVHADLCLAGHEHRLEQSRKLLVAELERQIPPDGGHISRNPSALVELLLDLMPLRRCFAARAKTPDPELLATIRRMTATLRHLRLGDGMPARFNGVGPGERGVIVTVLAYDEGRPADPAVPVRCGYVRLERGTAIVIADAAPPPPMELAGAACAGCLSFELSSGRELVLVNGGVPGEIDAGRRTVARATPSHNTLCLGEQSSAKLVRDARLEREIGGSPLRHPDHVTCTVREAAGAIELRSLPRRLRRALGPRAHADLEARCRRRAARGRGSAGARQRPPALCLGRTVRRLLPPASGCRGARWTLAGDGGPGAPQWRGVAPHRNRGGRIDRGRPLLCRRGRRVPRATGRAAGAVLRRGGGFVGARADASGRSGRRERAPAGRGWPRRRLAETSAGFEDAEVGPGEA